MALLTAAAAQGPRRARRAAAKPAPIDQLAPLLWRYLRPQGARVAMLALCLLGGVALQIVAPQMTSRFIDLVARFGAAAPARRLWSLAGLFIAATLIGQLVRLAGSYFSASVGWNAANRLREDLARHCLALDMSFHNARTPGELIERVDGDVSSLASVFSQFVFQILGSAVLLAGILAVLLVQNLRIGAALTLFSAAAFAVLFASRRLGTPLYAAERQARSELASFVEERVGGLDDVRANGGGGHVVRRLEGHNDTLTARGVRAIRVAAVYIVLIANGVFIAGFGLALSLGVYLFQRREASLGEVYLLIQYTAMLRQPLETIGGQIQDLQRTMASLGRVLELQAMSPRVRPGPGLAWTGASPRIEVDRVSFAYAEGEPVLSDVSFHLEPGATLGLLGRTGSGKTTLTRLICRLYDPTAGEIRFDGEPIAKATLAQLHAHVGVVTQDVQLFQASIRDNLTFFDSAIPDARLQGVLADLGLGAWLGRQAQGLDTVLQGSGGLSAGEAQRLAFARVFLKSPGVVLLDEASSRLDPATERLINRATERLLGGGDAGARRTTIIVAHRLSTVRRVDRIMILEAGRIAEHGARAALAADPGSRFSRLLSAGLEEVLS
ncbi:MAG TPA: ABC transporter ATP-binding protein [Caulobacteraceae bacterium]